ncbi:MULTISPECIES: TetR/AcrR family transcriptional regulator [unclassified Chelatococcus]|uniref:TetR/AcrR family transcriptional regulator n=1 Tax=unclassified Chelatococcus TaxID=2638111 RepID=UPI001BCAB6CE|nr:MULTISPECIES: TetR/AcrR family transcriptional regulator [unclassified Chelatococcus]CAH1656455.1 TetR family transcriptional regulator [Hyphomicrobiales bacterium]MBS7740537.1 TetR family transcriptional regulator [Chelatococcus sp. HY11]MBX3544679.1 TetR family transcriptional regulator [Chelatococcus sp.]MCO5078220.1 TetR family transcriptional regulator [Chelatococcus sp.]CAH1684738.1 TetR family transcriptional regulator [Hyphomicrobiales bacterium]
MSLEWAGRANLRAEGTQKKTAQIQTGQIQPEQDEASQTRAGQPPRTRDPEATRAKILAAATVEFAASGFAGASIDAIASRSQANRRMIYHYFGSKRGLWLAVLEAAYERARVAEVKLDLGRLAPEEAMRRLVTFTFDAFVGDRVFINLLNSENLHQARHLKTSSRVKEMHSPLIGMISEILDRGVAAGLFRAGIDPAQLWISIAGLSYFYFSNIHTLSVILDRNFPGKMEIGARRTHVAELILASLRT